jgi:hypothetical protein
LKNNFAGRQNGKTATDRVCWSWHNKSRGKINNLQRTVNSSNKTTIDYSLLKIFNKYYAL